MAIVMKKYNYNDKSYLVFDVKANGVDFDSRALAMVIQDEMGITADYFVILDDHTVVLDKFGYKVNATKDQNGFFTEIEEKAMANCQEVRFTVAYITRLLVGFGRNINIA